MLEAVHRQPGICFMAEEIPGKLRLGDPQMKAVRPVIASNVAPYLQMRSIGSHMSDTEEEGKKEMLMAGFSSCFSFGGKFGDLLDTAQFKARDLAGRNIDCLFPLFARCVTTGAPYFELS